MDPTQTKIYNSIGRCIYCSRIPAEAGTLTNEHIVPYGLGGNAEIAQGVCDRCKLMWEETDRDSLRVHFADCRLQLGIQSRSKKDSRRRHLVPKDVGITVSEGPRLTLPHASSLILPPNLMLPHLMPPGIISGIRRRQGPDHMPPMWHSSANTLNKPRMKEAVKNIGSIQFRQRFSYRLMQKFLMKIAHSFAVAEIGMDGFYSYMATWLRPELIEERAWLVGGLLKIELPEENLHRLSVECNSICGNHLVVVRIRIFARLESPTYQIVVGHYNT